MAVFLTVLKIIGIVLLCILGLLLLLILLLLFWPFFYSLEAAKTEEILKANGYEYMFISETVKLREYARKINEAFDGRGGGKDNVIQGSIRGDRKTIEEKVREVFGRNDYE